MPDTTDYTLAANDRGTKRTLRTLGSYPDRERAEIAAMTAECLFPGLLFVPQPMA